MMLKKLRSTQFSRFLKPRPPAAHKGDFGHVLVVGGDYGFSGAVRMAAEAALRVGAGLVSVATRPEHAWSLNLVRPEIMCHGVNAQAILKKLLIKATVIIVGPGIGQSTWSKKCLHTVLASQKPMVCDADALNILAKSNVPLKKSNWILTPHPGEAARLLNCSSAVVQKNRLKAAEQIQKKWGGTCVLKGAGTLIVSTGRAAICEAGNPGMATGGMGDVLSGVIGGLLAQGADTTMAAELGTLVHARAGDAAAKAGERGLLATDLFPYLRHEVNP